MNIMLEQKPSIAQLVERWTVEVQIDIHRSLVQLRLEGIYSTICISIRQQGQKHPRIDLMKLWFVLLMIPTWLEHATSWSGVRRATIAPRNRSRLTYISYVFKCKLASINSLSIFNAQPVAWPSGLRLFGGVGLFAATAAIWLLFLYESSIWR